MKTLADRVNWLCGAAGGGSREELSKLCGFASSTLGFYARDDRTRGSIETAMAIARTFGCDVGWLLNGDGVAPDESSVLAAIAAARVARANVNDVKEAG